MHKSLTEMSKSHFTLKFNGPGIENGEIDVHDLAPALVAIGNLFQAANATINGGKAKASVKVRATSEGSFEVDLTLIQTLIDTTKTFFDFAVTNKDGIAAANELAELVFKFSTALSVPAGGLFFLLKWLRGRKPDKVEEKGGDVTLYIGDNYFVTNKNTIRLAEDIAVREQAKNLVSVLERDGIESISARQTNKPELRIERNDIPSFEIIEPEEVVEEIQDEERQMTLQIISLTFKEENKWRFTDGAEPFNAAIQDIDFLNKISINEISFAKNDYLICKVREHQVRTSKGLKKERIITKVLDHKQAPRQLRLM